MVKKSIIIQNENGLHLRVASQIAKQCTRFQANITLCKGCDQAQGCSIMDMLMLAAPQGSEIEIQVSGQDEVQALAAVTEIFEGGGGI